MYCSKPGLPVPYHLPEFAQVHVHWINDAIQPSHPLSPSSAFSFSQLQGLSPWVSCSYQMVKYWSFYFSISPSNKYSGLFPLGLTGLISLLSRGLSRVFSSTIVQKHQFFSTLPSLWSNSHICTWILKTIALTIWTFVSKVVSLLF